MSDVVSAQIGGAKVVSALSHASFDGFAKVREIGPVGMISLRAKADLPGLAEAIMAAVGFAGLLVVILKSGEVQAILTGLVRTALSVAG